MSRYIEHVTAPHTVIIAVISLLYCSATAWVLPAETLWLRIGIFAFGLGLAGLLWIFSAIRLEVDAREVRFGFRLGSRRVPLDAIQRAEARRYDWTEFLGWGLRANLKRAEAWSLMGVKTCVRIYLKDGRTLVISSHRAVDAAEAIEAALGRGAP